MTRPPLTTRIREEYSRGTVPNGILVLTVGVVAVLLALQVLISTDIIPWDLATRYFFLNVQSPNLASVFLAQYVHTPFFPVRLVATALVFALTMCCICLFGYFVLPALGWKPPAHLMRNTFLCIFFLLPFLLSGIAIIVERPTHTTNVLYACGSSGIVAALMGFAVVLVAAALTMICRERWEEGRGCAWLYGLGIVAFLLPLLFWVVLGGRDVLPVAIRFGGYVFGLVVPLVLLWAGGAVEG